MVKLIAIIIIVAIIAVVVNTCLSSQSEAHKQVYTKGFSGANISKYMTENTSQQQYNTSEMLRVGQS